MKTALVTGVTGQDGAYLTHLLLQKGYRVVATHRRASAPNLWRIEDLRIRSHPNLSLCEFELTEPGGAIRLIDFGSTGRGLQPRGTKLRQGVLRSAVYDRDDDRRRSALRARSDPHREPAHPVLSGLVG